jgi:hypothetical protein
LRGIPSETDFGFGSCAETISRGSSAKAHKLFRLLKKNARHKALQLNASDLLSGVPAAANYRA